MSVPEPGTPPGWSYNPSHWPERWPVLGLALLGFLIAGYLSLYQLGVFGHVWEPFFGSGSTRVLHSAVARLLPIPDASLGALGYLADAVTGLIGGRERWRTMPWIVLLFGLVVGPLGSISITLVVLQPVLFHAWCTLCLASALISVCMIGPAMDEVLATLQHLKREQARGISIWTAIRGGSATAAAPIPAEGR